MVMPKDCPVPQGSECKRKKCEHGDVCDVHCAVCIQSKGTPRGRGRPRNKRRSDRITNVSEPSYVEVEKDDDFKLRTS